MSEAEGGEDLCIGCDGTGAQEYDETAPRSAPCMDCGGSGFEPKYGPECICKPLQVYMTVASADGSMVNCETTGLGIKNPKCLVHPPWSEARVQAELDRIYAGSDIPDRIEGE